MSRETYQAVQELQKSKSKGCFVKKDRYPLSTMLKCPVCGHNYRRQIVNGKAYWVCSYKASGRVECTSERISEESAKEAFVRMTDKLVRNREDLLGDLIRQLEKMQSRVSGNHEKVYQIDCRIADINAQNLVVAQLHNKGILNNAEFTAQSGELSRKVSELRSERRRIIMEDEDDELIDTLRTLDETLAEYIPANTFDEDLFEQIVESITVISGQKLSFRLAGGLVLTEKI